jgi:uncharacterized membrane protein YkvA (DUF1232 family)
MVRRMPAYLRLSWRLAKDPVLSKARRAAVVGAAGYLASPIDLVPGVIPVLGQLDDIAVAIAALKIALSGLDPERRRVHLESVGLADEHLAADLRAIGATTAWMGRAGYRTTRRAASAGGKAAGSAARTTKGAVSRATPAAKAAADRVTPVVRGAADRATPVARAVGAKASPVARAVTSTAGPAARVTVRVTAGTTRKAADLGAKALGAAGAALGRGSKEPPEPTVTVDRVDVPLLPPPPPDRATD